MAKGGRVDDFRGFGRYRGGFNAFANPRSQESLQGRGRNPARGARGRHEGVGTVGKDRPDQGRLRQRGKFLCPVRPLRPAGLAGGPGHLGFGPWLWGTTWIEEMASKRVRGRAGAGHRVWPQLRADRPADRGNLFFQPWFLFGQPPRGVPPQERPRPGGIVVYSRQKSGRTGGDPPHPLTVG